MDRIIRLAKENWEVLVLSVTCLIAVVSISVSFWGSDEEETVRWKSNQKLERPKVLSDKAFAYLAPRRATCGRNPFELPAGLLEPPKPKPRPAVAPKPKPVVPPVVVVSPEPEPNPEPEAEPEPKPPTMAPGTFEFVFQKCNNDGRTIALVKAQRQGGDLQVVTVGVGEAVMGVKVLSISEERIQLQDAKGNRGTIPLGDKRRVIYLTN